MKCLYCNQTIITDDDDITEYHKAYHSARVGIFCLLNQIANHLQHQEEPEFIDWDAVDILQNINDELVDIAHIVGLSIRSETGNTPDA